MMFYPGDWSKDPALTLCTSATRGIWIDLICAMHNLDQCGELRGTAEQLCRFARCSTVEFVQAMTDLRTNRAADVTERNGVYEICNRRMQAAYKSRKSNYDRVKRHRERKRNGECNAEDSPHISEIRDQIIKPPPPVGFKPGSALPPEWAAVEGVLFGFGMARAPEAIAHARAAGCNAVQVGNLIEFWRGHQPHWGIGLLFDRLMRFRPDQGFDQLWPEESGGVKQVTAEQFQKHLAGKDFNNAGPKRDPDNPARAFGTLRNGTKIECRSFPPKKSEATT